MIFVSVISLPRLNKRLSLFSLTRILIRRYLGCGWFLDWIHRQRSHELDGDRIGNGPVMAKWHWPCKGRYGSRILWPKWVLCESIEKLLFNQFPPGFTLNDTSCVTAGCPFSVAGQYFPHHGFYGPSLITYSHLQAKQALVLIVREHFPSPKSKPSWPMTHEARLRHMMSNHLSKLWLSTQINGSATMTGSPSALKWTMQTLIA